MRKTSIGGAFRLSWLAALMAALLLVLPGCHTPEGNGDTDTPVPGAEAEVENSENEIPPQSPNGAGPEEKPPSETVTVPVSGPDPEFDVRVKKYRNDVARYVDGLEDGPPDGGTYPAIWDTVSKIKKAVEEWKSEESSVSWENLVSLSAEVDALLVNIDSALKNSENSAPAKDALNQLFINVSGAGAYLNLMEGPRRGAAPPANADSAAAEESGGQANDSEVLAAVQGLAQELEGLKESVNKLSNSEGDVSGKRSGGSDFLLWVALIIIIATALFGAASAYVGSVKIVGVYDAVSKMATYRSQYSQGSGRKAGGQTRNAETPGEEEKRKPAASADTTDFFGHDYRPDTRIADSGARPAAPRPLDGHPMDSGAKMMKLFKTDDSESAAKGGVWLYEAHSHDEFSGTPVPGSPDRYYIWPDPWGLKTVPDEMQELKDMQRYYLYNRYVTRCFDITPNDPGNTQNFHLRLDKYAVIKKSGTSYQVINRGKITAFPL